MTDRPEQIALATLTPARLRSRLRALHDLPLAPPPLPWRKVGDFAVGGLQSVGFADNSDLLLVASFQGRGLFDCLSGTRIARDDSEPYPEDTARCTVEGIGPLAGQSIRVAGSYGGGLPLTTSDGWSLECLPLSWPTESVLLLPPYQDLWSEQHSKIQEFTRLPADPLRAFGFSETGRTFVIATSSDVAVFGR